MHILFVVSWYKDKNNRIAGSFFEEQARALLKMGHRVSILYPELITFRESGRDTYEEFDDDGLFTMVQKVKAIFPSSRQLNYWWLARKAFATYKKYIVKFGRPDILHAQVFRFGGIVANYIHKKTQIPYVITEHYSLLINPNGIRHKTDLIMARKVYMQALSALTVSRFLKEALNEKLHLPPATFCVIPNMVNSIFFEQFAKKSLASDEIVNFLHIANLVPVKNQSLLLRAFKFFLDRYTITARLSLIGDGVLLDELKDLVASLGLNEHVVFMKRLGREQTVGEIQKSHIVLISSRIETFCLALAEALAVGRPVVSTACGGPNEFINSSNGELVNSFDDEQQYAEAMYRVVRAYNGYDQASISNACYQKFSEKSVSKAILQSYGCACT